MFGAGNIDINSAEFSFNRALGTRMPSLDFPVIGLGGGIYLYLYEAGTSNYYGHGITFNMSDKVLIHDNYAKNKGGGLCIELAASDYVGFNAMTVPLSDPDDPETFTICNVTIEDGGSIYGNYAEQGGGFCILDFLPRRHRSVHYPEVVTKTLRRVVTVKGGEIKNNHAKALDTESVYISNDDYYGGGFFINKTPRINAAGELDPNILADYNEFGAWRIDVEFEGGKLFNNTAKTNNHGYGGGFCMIDGFEAAGVNCESYCNVVVDGSVELYKNESDNDGGGIYLNGGNFTLKNGTIGKENNPNKTLGGDGGGICVSNGNFTMKGGSFAYNQAKKTGNNGGNGGGFYVNGGIVSVEGGTIGYNTADVAGGGFYVNTSSTSDTTFIKGGAQVTYNRALNGGGAYINQGTLYIEDAATAIAYDTAYIAGGAIYMANGTVYDTLATLSGNISLASNGGAFYIGNGDIRVAHASVTGNKAPNGDGGGAYVGSGNVYFTSGTTVTGNSAQNGGGIYIGDGNIEYKNAVVSGNAADYWGGGLYVAGDFNFEAGSVKQNHAGTQGGGVYITTGGVFTMTGGAIGGALADGNYTTEAESFGGGLYMGGGTATISNSTIGGNYTYSRADLDSYKGCGGAIYMAGGSCTLSNNATIGGANANYANTSKYGGAIYSADGTIRVKGGKIGYNKAQYGGGIYSNGDNAKVYVEKYSSKADVLSYIEYNEAEYGGGIYGEKGRVEFSDGYIQYNTASQQGGGIYVDANDTLYLKGSANMLLNGVPTGHKGGGVYLVGSLIVGEQTTPLGTILAQDNYAYTTTQPDTLLTSSSTGHVVDSLRNNVFLPNPVAHTYTASTHAGVIEVVENGISTASYVGFSVLHGNVPVIFCKRSGTSQAYLHDFSTGQPKQYNLFDDSGRYRSVQYSNDPAFDPDHVYLYGFWSDEVTGGDGDYCVVDKSIFTTHEYDTIPITTPCELAYFISWVNGRVDPTPLTAHPNANAKLMADIDMSEFGWVPIGKEGNAYGGVFNGNGHTVTGVRSLLNEDHTDYGFFGKLAAGAKVKDLFVKEASFHIEKKALYTDPMYIGGIAGRTSGNATISNCEIASVIVVEPDNMNTIVGGLVGATASGDKISSSIGIADMSGFKMGGLTGENAGEILNSFANAKFTKLSGSDQYYGGLAGGNTGTIENCYARLQNTGAMDNTWFGHLVGDNTNGHVNYSYAKAETYTASGKTGTLTEVGYYDDNTLTPYLYARRDNQVHVAGTNLKYVPSATNPNPNPALSGIPGDQQMLLCLENWVKDKNAHGGSYKHWSRTTTKAINDDLPILKMDHGNVNAVYCAGNADGTENNPYINYGEINGILATQRQAGEAIWLYKSTDTINGNAGSNAKLYIDEGVTVIQRGPLTAYVGVTLDNSANIGGANPTFGEKADYTDWHMFSTPLANAPLGINYVKTDGTTPDDTQWGEHFEYGHPSGMPYYRFYDDDAHHGYFPSMTYEYGKSNAYNGGNADTASYGNYYKQWDFYTYYEPEYHWINFKRNSNSHWHQDVQDIKINYTNETVLKQGRGYLVATREETFLQCQGLLNGTSGQISIPVTYSGYYSPGYNFLGNPYLAYLDFDAFADVNRALWGGTASGYSASYAVIDEDEGGYIYRAINCSANPNTAPQYIAPHQGFMILADEGIEDDAAAVFYSTGTGDMRSLTGDGGKFRGEEQPAYPLVNLIATDGNGNRDIATVELGRPDKGGAPLMRELRLCNGHVWCHYEGKDWAIAFTQPGLTEAAIRFETYEDGEYTMRWNTQNGDFSYLHLIDNLTGTDVDCLATDEYRFASTTTDYKSRFRLVFGYTGIDEPETDEPIQGSFAYQSGDELVVTGEGTVELFDVTGRRMSAERIEGVQGTVSVSGLTPGVYLLRLATATGTRVQKIVINQ